MKLLVDKKGFLVKPDFNDEEKIILPTNTKIVCDFAFEDFCFLKEARLPSGINAIGASAFHNCLNLERVNLPSSLIDIENSAFSGCESLEKIEIPDSVDYIKEMTFLNCTSLKEVKLSPYTTSICDFAFKNCYKLKSINLPDSIERIGIFSFIHCTNLESIDLPPKLTYISDFCFSACINLKSIKIPSKVKIIHDSAFYDCLNLEEIHLPESLEVIKELAFTNCNKVNKITLSNYSNLAQPGFSNLLGNINHMYFNPKTGELILTKNKISKKDNLDEIDFNKYIETLNCNKKDAIILSSLFTLEDLKDKKLNFIPSIIEHIYREPNYETIIINISKNNKEFNNLYKKLSIDVYLKNNLLMSNNASEIYSLFKFAYNIGAFNENQIERQKACEFIATLFQKNMINMYNIDSYFSKLKINGYNKEWADFVMDKANASELFDSDTIAYNYITKAYNEFPAIKEFARSNKGNQHYNKITLDACKTYLSESKFLGITSTNEDIASLLSKFTRNQETFNIANEIRNEYLSSNINDHLLSEILNEKAIIEKQIADTTANLRKIAYDTFTFEFLSKYDATNFVLGKYCSCCSHLEAAGLSIVKASILHPDCQNLVIRNKEGKIVAKSTLYINKKEGYGVFNTIEVDEDITPEEKKHIFKKYMQAVALFAEKYNEENKNNPLKQINVGVRKNDLLKELEKHTIESRTILKGIDFSIYGKNTFYYEGDWKHGQRIVWKNNNHNIK